MFLSNTDFCNVIKNTPLVSIDFIISNKNEEVLLGLRRNRPAKDYWFVPGGRIFKNETIKDAFARISETELGEKMAFERGEFLGIYEHFYNDNIFEDNTFSTHYIVMAYALKLDLSISNLPTLQHIGYRWFSKETIKTAPEIHENSKTYLIP